MNILLRYIPDHGIFFGDLKLSWGMPRSTIRAFINGSYEPADVEIAGIFYRRDIYTKIDHHPVFLFLNYTTDEKFVESEIHQGVDLCILDKTIQIGMSFLDAVNTLSELTSSSIAIEEGEVLFPELKLSISSGARMGGEEKDESLSYIYCTTNIEHLLT